jgi:hypothetical protein
MPTKKHLSLSFPQSAFKIMKRRKNAYMKKEGIKKLTWSDFIIIKVLI